MRTAQRGGCSTRKRPVAIAFSSNRLILNVEINVVTLSQVYISHCLIFKGSLKIERRWEKRSAPATSVFIWPTNGNISQLSARSFSIYYSKVTLGLHYVKSVLARECPHANKFPSSVSQCKENAVVTGLFLLVCRGIRLSVHPFLRRRPRMHSNTVVLDTSDVMWRFMKFLYILQYFIIYSTYPQLPKILLKI